MNRYTDDDFRDRRKQDVPGLALALLLGAFAAGCIVAILWGR